MEDEGKGSGDVKERRHNPSRVHLNLSCASPPGPGGPALWEETQRATLVGGRKTGREERVWRENEKGSYSLPRGSVVLISVRISNLNILSS